MLAHALKEHNMKKNWKKINFCFCFEQQKQKKRRKICIFALCEVFFCANCSSCCFVFCFLCRDLGCEHMQRVARFVITLSLRRCASTIFLIATFFLFCLQHCLLFVALLWFHVWIKLLGLVTKFFCSHQPFFLVRKIIYRFFFCCVSCAETCVRTRFLLVFVTNK